MGKIRPASCITSGSAHQLKALAFDYDNANDDESFSDDSDKNNNPQSEAGAGQTDEEDDNSIEEQIPATWMKKHSDGSRHRIKVADFDDISKDILVTAISIFRYLIVTQVPFPDSIADETMLGKEAWHEACQLKGINIKLMPLAMKMLLQCTSHVHGELKMKMRSLTQSFYGFQSKGSSFIFKDWTMKTGIYKTELLQDGINVMWFANQSDEGIVYNKFFNPMPIKVIALMLTAIECYIDKWMQGMKEDIKFTAIIYGSVYNDHLNSLQCFDEHMAPYKLFERICDNLHDVAHFHAGIETPTTVSNTSRISDKAFEDAIQEHQLQEESAW
ncbi:uncharacterized protein F5891DRAFT_1189053 [Suillus fuscotomentosus]|uniref:DUF6532 domain-containing protein n=1 Tax=Suillus fuscotomentosus TaxID=1912939 RepID=A0AAD4HKI1_9AGAM|nr:uncharacterized protein F5891DRAFT_1189053 [Suillus fuscotomentosus]KAG1899968.1 hypothetical protein F5891DRAFT_1189053 [Suillus fuscotomentosus]